MRLSKTVDEQDVREAIRLINVATQRAAMDPRTGTINMDLLTTGNTSEDRENVSVLVGKLRDMLATRHRGYTTTVGQLVKDVAGTTDVSKACLRYGDMSTADGSWLVQMAISSDDVIEALREMEGDEEPIVKLQGSSKVTVIA